MTPLDKLCTTAQRIRDRADERDMAWRELKGAAEAIERMEGGVSVERGGVESRHASRLWPSESGHEPIDQAIGQSEHSTRSRSSARPSLLSSIAYILAGLVFLVTWLAAVLLEEPAGKPTPPYYKTFQERLGE